MVNNRELRSQVFYCLDRSFNLIVLLLLKRSARLRDEAFLKKESDDKLDFVKFFVRIFRLSRDDLYATLRPLPGRIEQDPSLVKPDGEQPPLFRMLC